MCLSFRETVSVRATSMMITRAHQNTGGALSYTAQLENWYATGNFEQVEL